MKDKLAYVVIEGDRSSPNVVDQAVLTLPQSARGAQLTWVRQEVTELCRRHHVERAAFKAAEATASGDSARGEVEGVVQQAFHEAGIETAGLLKSQCKSRLGLGRSRGGYDEALKQPPISTVPTGPRREAMAVAVATLDA